jgi:hypothetical protein
VVAEAGRRAGEALRRRGGVTRGGGGSSEREVGQRLRCSDAGADGGRRGAASDRRCGSGVGIGGGSFRIAREGGAVALSI